MGNNPIANMLSGQTDATLDPVLQRQAQESNKLREQEEEEQRRLQALQEQQQAQAQAQDQALQKAAEGSSLGNRLMSSPAVEGPTSFIGGAIDALEQVGDKFNQPWMEIPDNWEPQNKTAWGQALRELVTAVGPSIGLALLTRRGTAALTKASGLPTPPKWVRAVGNAGTDIAAGVAWDSIGKHAEDDNALGSLKKIWPKAFGWIPDDLATLDTDSPDIKRLKNQREGAGIGLLTSTLEGAVALSRAFKGLAPGVEFIAKDGQAAKNLDDIANKAGVNYSDSPLIDRIIRDERYRDKSVDEIAEMRFKQKGLDEPDPFIHSPIFDDSERLAKAVRPDGLMQAMVDSKRIQDNLGTVNGRMASFMTDAAVEGLDMADLEGRNLIKKIEDAIRNSGNFEAKLPDGKMLSKSDILKAGDNLAAVILDPRMSGSDLQKMFDEFNLRDFKQDLNLAPISDAAYGGAMKAITELKNFYLNLDTARASAYLQTSLAGEVSDLATATRVMGDEQDITRAQELIFDKLQALWYETDMSSSIAGWSLNNKKTWKTVLNSGDSNAIQRFAKEAEEQISKTTQVKAENRATFLRNLKEINAKNPEYLKPLSLAYELSDGDVNSIHKLTKYMANVLGTRKILLDQEPQIPSQVVQSLFSTFYNLKLSSLMTPVKALSNNFALLLMKPANVMLGAALRGDGQTIHRAWVQYATHMDTTMRGAADYMGSMFKRVAADPSVTQRADFATRNSDMLDAARAFADAEASQGRYAAQMKVGFVDAMTKINDHPWFRYSMNFMEAGDAFVKSSIAMAEARGRAFDQIIAEGRKITPSEVERISDDIYRSMFNSDGLITDEAVAYASGEIAMNLDHPLADGLNNMLNKAPLLKTLVMFPRTSVNVLDFVHKHSPLSVFAGEFNKVNSLRESDEIAEFLASKGLQFNEAIWNNYKSEVIGRVAMGTMLVSTAGWMYAQGNLTGNGYYDKQVNKYQQNVGERPLRSWRGLDGKWRTFDSIEPIATFFAVTADILDNIETLGSTTSEKMLQKVGFALSMNLTNKSFLQGLQPITELASGQPAAISRWASNTASVGLFNQMARTIIPGLREVDAELQTMLRNKWNILDTVGVGKPLPFKYDFIDGGVVGKEDPVTNLFNNLLPFKTSTGPSPEKQFLIDAEFDVQPSLTTSLRGVKYSVDQRSRLAQIMGESGMFKKGLNDLMKNPEIKKDLERIKQLRSAGVSEDAMKLSNSRVHDRLRELTYRTVDFAKRQLAQESPDLRLAEIKAQQVQTAQKQGNYGQILNLNNK